MSHGSACADVGAVSGKQVIPSSWRYNVTISSLHSEGGTEIWREFTQYLQATSAFIERHYEDTHALMNIFAEKCPNFQLEVERP